LDVGIEPIPRAQPPIWLVEAEGAVDFGADDTVVLLGEGSDNATGLPLAGPDALAYYVPYHFSCNCWGIYIRAYIPHIPPAISRADG